MGLIENILSRGGGRKFISSICSILLFEVAATMMLWMGYLTGEQWINVQDIMKWVVLSFLGTNAAEGVAATIKGKNGSNGNGV